MCEEVQYLVKVLKKMIKLYHNDKLVSHLCQALETIANMTNIVLQQLISLMISVNGKGCRDEVVYINVIFIFGMQECTRSELFFAIVNVKVSKNFDDIIIHLLICFQ